MIDDLVRACVAAPEDERPRLVWADAIGGDRGELVVLQCDLARGSWPPVEVAKRRQRERELLGAYGMAWSGLEGLATRIAYVRGFVETIEIDAQMFLDHATTIFERAPLLNAIHLTGLEGDIDYTKDAIRTGPDGLALLRALVAHRSFPRLEGISFGSIGTRTTDDSDPGYGYEGQGIQASAILAEARALSRLRAFEIEDAIDVARILEANVEHIEHVRLPYTSQSDLETLFARMPRLRSVDVGHTRASELIPILPKETRRLHVWGVDDKRLALLASHPCATHLEWLLLDQADIVDPAPLASFPKLRALDIFNTRLGRAGYDETEKQTARMLAKLSFPSLRDLYLPSSLQEESLRAIVEGLGPKLDLVDLRSWHATTLLPDLVQHVAGEIRVGLFDRRPLLEVRGGRAWA